MPDRRKHVVGFLEAFLKYGKNHSVMIILAGAVVLLQCLIVIFYEDTTVDAAYYVGTVSTSVYTDTLGRYNPFNGAIQKAFQARYVFSAYPMHNAVWCRLMGIHPIVQAKQVMSCMNVVTANQIIYQIGKRLFDGNRKKADLMLVFVCVLQLFCGTIYSSGTFSLPEATREKPSLPTLPSLQFSCVPSGICRRKTAGMSGSYVCHSGQCADIFRFCYHLSYRDRSGNGSGGSYE